MDKSRPPSFGTARIASLLPPNIQAVVAGWLAEDIPSFDPAGAVVGPEPVTASLWIKSPGVLAGVPWANEVFAQCQCTVEWHLHEDGALLDPATSDWEPGRIKVATVAGPAFRLLQAERVALNILARCSGVATATCRVQERARRAGFAGSVAGTRKTTPGFRAVEKYGMILGGADPHRMSLSSMVMLKDNHIWATGSIECAVHAAKAVAGFALKVDVEVRDRAEADEAIEAGADVVMLDNFQPYEAKLTAREIKGRWEGQRQFLVEVSGGITADNVADYVCPEIDVISTSAIHQGVPHVDFSLKVVKR